MAHKSPLVQRLARALTAIATAKQVWRILLLLFIVAVGYLALTPIPPPSIDFGWDKLNHLVAFSTLAFSASLSWPASRRVRLLMYFMLFAYGGLIEVLQQFVPGRACEWADLFADSVGIVLGAGMAAGLARTASSKAPAI
jgi:VanZ family protein